MLRSILLFVHVISAMGMFTALGMESVILAQLAASPEPEQTRRALWGFGRIRRTGAPSLALALLTGIYLASAASAWSDAWVVVAIGGIVLVAVVGATLTGMPVVRFEKAGAGPEGLAPLLGGLRASLALRAATVAGIVFLMTVKPGPAGAIGAMGVAIGLGLAGAALLRRRGRPVP